VTGPDPLTPGRLERLDDAVQKLPGAIGQITQVVIDNPGQMALIACGTIVATRAAINIVRPRTALEALALMVFLQIAIPRAAIAAIDKGWLTIRIRDDGGRLVPLEPLHA
jgi:hypothetical protein